MSAPSPEELRSLRARAYGPNPDIHDDPVALARLRELEAAALVEVQTPESEPDAEVGPDLASPTAPAGDSQAGRGSASPSTADSASEPKDSDPTDASASVATPRWAGRTVLGIVAVFLVGVVIGGILTFSMLESKPGSVATLEVDPDAVWPNGVFGDQPEGSRLFDSFLGLVFIAIPQTYMEADEATPCLYALTNAEISTYSIISGCGTESFAPTASAVVTERFPQELRDAYPIGTQLQFVLDGDRVIVYAQRS